MLLAFSQQEGLIVLLVPWTTRILSWRVNNYVGHKTANLELRILERFSILYDMFLDDSLVEYYQGTKEPLRISFRTRSKISHRPWNLETVSLATVEHL
jgi:hypothetical protein